MGIFKIAAGKKPKKGANADINASTAQTAAVTETTENTATCNETLAFNAMYGGILNALKAEGNGFVGMTDDEADQELKRIADEGSMTAKAFDLFESGAIE